MLSHKFSRALLLFTVLAVTAKETLNFTIHDGIFLTFNTTLICPYLDSCDGNNPNSPYSRPLWPFLGDTVYNILNGSSQFADLTGSHPMNMTDAIVVWGKIPTNETYWAVTGYLFDIPTLASSKNMHNRSENSEEPREIVWASVADSVSAARVVPRSPNDSMAIIFTANPLLVRSVKAVFLNQTWNSTDPIQFFPILIPRKMYRKTYRYNMLSRVVFFSNRTNETIPESTPNFKCQWFIGSPHRWHFHAEQHPIPRGSSPSEASLMTPLVWFERARVMVGREYKIVDDSIITAPYLSEKIPGGVDYGYDCLEHRVNCRADNRDTIYYIAKNIEVNQSQAIVVVALNHFMTSRARFYSSLTFSNQLDQYSYRSSLTGGQADTAIRVPPAPVDVAIEMIYDVPPQSVFDDNGIATVFIAERCYVDPTTTIGPTYSSVLPFHAFIVEKTPAPEKPKFVIE